MACSGENCSPHPSQNLGRALGVRPNLNRMLSLNSSAERSVPLRMEGMVDSHDPVSAERRILRFSRGVEHKRIVSSWVL